MSSPRLFADDTCLILKDSKFEKLNHKIETEVTNVNKWLKAIKLSLNSSKSNTMILDQVKYDEKINSLTKYNS